VSWNIGGKGLSGIFAKCFDVVRLTNAFRISGRAAKFCSVLLRKQRSQFFSFGDGPLKSWNKLGWIWEYEKERNGRSEQFVERTEIRGN
jgi:hypothetical protein